MPSNETETVCLRCDSRGNVICRLLHLDARRIKIGFIPDGPAAASCTTKIIWPRRGVKSRKEQNRICRGNSRPRHAPARLEPKSQCGRHYRGGTYLFLFSSSLNCLPLRRIPVRGHMAMTDDYDTLRKTQQPSHPCPPCLLAGGTCGLPPGNRSSLGDSCRRTRREERSICGGPSSVGRLRSSIGHVTRASWQPAHGRWIPPTLGAPFAVSSLLRTRLRAPTRHGSFSFVSGFSLLGDGIQRT